MKGGSDGRGGSSLVAETLSEGEGMPVVDTLCEGANDIDDPGSTDGGSPSVIVDEGVTLIAEEEVEKDKPDAGSIAGICDGESPAAVEGARSKDEVSGEAADPSEDSAVD